MTVAEHDYEKVSDDESYLSMRWDEHDWIMINVVRCDNENAACMLWKAMQCFNVMESRMMWLYSNYGLAHLNLLILNYAGTDFTK